MKVAHQSVSAIVGLGLCCGISLAQPDVTLSDVRSVQKYEPNATSAMISYSIGSHTCNLGNQGLAWINNGSPGLAMNMYRIHDGRIMQIGLSFVKHACCAGDQNNSLCGTCGPSGSELGPGCLDVYGAGYNSTQIRLGPRSGINAYNRTFSALPGGSGDANFRRIQVLRSDATPANFPGAIYLVEGVYVAQDETLAQTVNNASYKRVGMTSAQVASVGPEIAALGQPAIAAWAALGGPGGTVDAGVTMGQAQVVGEGRYWYAHKVRQLSPTSWRYEYAVFNLNSDAAGGSFSVPVPVGVVVSNIGFHAPDYHSNELYSNADWSASRVGDSLTWSSPQTFAQNPNTNALRWGTMYNFWFDADRPPATTNPTATLGMFKTSASTSFAVVAPGVTPCDGIDFNNDGGLFDPTDIDAFLSVFAEGPCIPATASCNDIDFNNDGGLFDPCDIDAFLLVFGEGPCTNCGG